MQARSVHLLISAIFSLGLFACTNKGTESDLRVARWVRHDTTAVYTVHRFQWESEGGRVFTDVRTSEIKSSHVRLYAMEVSADTAGWHFLGKRLIAQIQHAVPCDDLVFDAEDSTVSFSWLRTDRAKPRDCYGSNEDTAPNPSRLLFIAKIDGSPAGQGWSSTDSAARLALLATDKGRRQDVPFAIPGSWRYCDPYDSPCLEVPER